VPIAQLTWRDSLASWALWQKTRDADVVEISQRYREYVQIFEAAHAQVVEAARIY
jgi:hypothetical protein